MQTKKFFWCIALIAALMMSQPPEVYAGGKKAVVSSAMARILARDAARDTARMVEAKALQKSTKVWRYTSRDRAESALRRGLPPGTHFTSGVTRGRLPAATTAQKRYGLPINPEVRMTIQLPRGQQVIRNKVIGGAPGQGEIVIRDSLPAGSIRNIKPLP